MRNKVVISLDVGGTNIDGALVSSEAHIIGEIHNMESVSGQDFETAIQHLQDFIADIRDSSDLPVAGCSIGMPNPFDYQNGISYMKHKFTAFYGKNIRQPLEDTLGIPVYFVNDADAFALGAYWKQGHHAKKMVGITLGTGLGSGFITNGEITISGNSVPSNGEIWNLPYREGILEDYVSGRGVVSLYKGLAGMPLAPDVIADLARRGDKNALEAYRQMGSALGEGLAGACQNFEPEMIVIGGKLGHACDIFLNATVDAFRPRVHYETEFRQAQSDVLPILGAARHAFDAAVG